MPTTEPPASEDDARDAPLPTLPARREDWIAKTLAGLLLGLLLALGCSGLFARLASSVPVMARAQLTMWLVPPIWLVTFGATFFFSTGKRAWLWLVGANLIVLAAFAAARHV